MFSQSLCVSIQLEASLDLDHLWDSVHTDTPLALTSLLATMLGNGNDVHTACTSSIANRTRYCLSICRITKAQRLVAEKKQCACLGWITEKLGLLYWTFNLTATGMMFVFRGD